MPCQTDRQLAADALHRAFLIQLVAEAEVALHDSNDYDDHDSNNDSADDLLDSDDDNQPLSHVLLESLVSIYTPITTMKRDN